MRHGGFVGIETVSGFERACRCNMSRGVMKTPKSLHDKDFSDSCLAQQSFAGFRNRSDSLLCPVTHWHCYHIPNLEFNIMSIIGHFTLKRVSLSRAHEDALVRAHILGLRLGLRGIALARVEMPKNSVRAFYRTHKQKPRFLEPSTNSVPWSCGPADPYALDRDPRTETKPINYRLRGAVLPAECDVGVLAGRGRMRGSRALYASSDCHFQFRRRCAVLPMCREMPNLLPSMMPSPPWRRVWRKSFEIRLPYLDRVLGVALPRYSPAFSLRRLAFRRIRMTR